MVTEQAELEEDELLQLCWRSSFTQLWWSLWTSLWSAAASEPGHQQTGRTDEEGSAAGGHCSPSWIIQTSLYTTCWADRIQSDTTRLDMLPVTGKTRYSMKPFWVVTGGCLLSLREIWSKRRGCTEKDPVIALLGCCRHLSFEDANFSSGCKKL